MKIKVLDGDSLCLEDGRIWAVVSGREFNFDLSEIEEALIITTDLGPFEDDMCLALRIDSETAIFIMSAHPCYSVFLFDQLGSAVELDYEQIIKASQSIGNAVFSIYKRG